jgi:ubiquinone/menaquinone biosynthesis C-methylase UbiE
MKQPISKFIEIYSKIYDLPQIKAVKYAKNLYLFLYTDNKRIGQFGYSSELKNENIHSTLLKLAGCIKIGEIMPVAVLNKTGIVFMARATNNILPIEGIEIPSKIERLIQKNLKHFDKNYLQRKEIETNHRYKLRYWIHNNFIKRFILTNHFKKTDAFNRLLLNRLTGRKFLDVSCGDSTLLNIKKDSEIIVFNDISLDMLISKEICPKAVITNHDATKLPFKAKSFDSVLCRNTLHHMPSDIHLNNLIDSMVNMSNHIVIVEIENPDITGGVPKILNKYLYRKFLHDVGERYFSEHEFKTLLSKRFNNIAFLTFHSPIGNYMIADIIIGKKP